jgi:iron complex outermembrane receptor protein
MINVFASISRSPCRYFLVGGLGLFLSLTARATTTNTSVADLSLEELLDVKVTSVSKKEEKLADAAAAIFVLNNDDLRRSGATSFAEALRLVPGLHVAAANSAEWAISARGFTSLYANKLLVLVDGRTVYNPIFAGVFWDLQQMNLEDVDRVEVIRGPGATVWGANAVNGVINVVSKSARDTQGTFLYGSGGDVHLTMDGARYGGKLGKDTYYRIEGGYQLTDDYPLANGNPGGDSWQSERLGFRLDHHPDAATHLTWQAGTVVNQLADYDSDAYNVNTLGRWTHVLSDRASVEVQAYYDRTDRKDVFRGASAVDTFDLTAQNTFGVGERHEAIWGLGYRFAATRLQEFPNTPFLVQDNQARQQLFSAFVQDEIKLIPDKLTFTAGIKLEHNEFTGLELQPSFRASFKPADNQTLWASVSRAVRTPSEFEGANMLGVITGPNFIGPGGGLYTPVIFGNGNPASEVLWAYELGYRIQPAKWVSVDLATYYNEYTDLIGFDQTQTTFTPGTPGVAALSWANTQEGRAYGGEASLTVAPLDYWRLTTSYALVQVDITGPGFGNSTPKHQVMIRSSLDISAQMSLDAQIRYVDSLIARANPSSVPDYVTADVRWSYRPTPQLEFSLVGQNLFSRQHAEQPASTIGAITTEVPRGFYGKFTWKF